MTSSELVVWHRAFAAAAEIDLLGVRTGIDDNWLELRIRACAGDPWDVSISMVPWDVSISVAGAATLHTVYMDTVLLTHRAQVTRPQAIDMIRAVVRDPRGNVGSPTMPSLSAHIWRLVQPWQGPRWVLT